MQVLLSLADMFLYCFIRIQNSQMINVVSENSISANSLTSMKY